MLAAIAATVAADVPGLSALAVAGALAQGGFGEPSAADATDPYVVAQAAALGNDVQAIFAFVRDEIAGEPYRGSLRGARGALWSRAANPLDRSSLLIALLRAAGVTSARYARGNLGFPNLTTLVQSMFSPPARAVGCVPGNVFLYQPEFDGELVTELQDHFWVELDQGGGFVAADASFPTAQLGDVFTAKTSSFDEVPVEIAHRVRVKVVAETFSQAAAAFALNGGLGETVVLDRTFRSSSLSGRPLSVGQFVDVASFGGVPFVSTTNTYTPWLLVGEGDAEMADDPIIVGTPFQETLTNFPLGSQLVTGVFLELEVTDAFFQTRRFERTLYDRIGFAVRENGGSVAVPPAATPAPVLNDFDVATLHVLPGRLSLEAFVGQRDRVQQAQQDVADLEPLLAGVSPGGPYTAEQVALLQEASEASRYLAIANNETLALGFDATADAATAQLSLGYLVKAFPHTPRLTLAITRKEGDDARVELDVLKNDLRVKPISFQNPRVAFWFSFARGLLEASLEGQVLAAATGEPAVSILEVLQALPDPGDLALVTGRTLEVLEALPLSDEAKSRIRAATAADRVVVTPTRMVTIGTTTTVGWLEVDASGHTVSVFENGGHQAISQYAGALEFSAEFNEPFAKFIGFVSGFGQVGFVYAAAVVDAIATGGGLDEAVKETKESIEEILGDSPQRSKLLADLIAFATKFSEDTAGASLLASMVAGLIEGIEFADRFILRNLPHDPPAFPFLSSDLAPPAPPVAPGPTPAVSVSLVPDSFFTVPFDGAEVPTAFELHVTNLGPTAEDFDVTAPAIAGFTVRPSVGRIRVGAGETGEVGICLTPAAPLGAIGAPVSFDATATSATNAAVTGSDGETFSYPAFQGLTASLSPDDATTNAGVPVQVRLALRATGNLGGPVDLTLQLPPGVTAQGLVSPVDLVPGQVLTQDLMLTPDATVPLDTDVVVPLAAELGPVGARQTVRTRVVLRVVDPGAQCAGEAATAARDIGRSGLADVLLAIATAMSDLAGDPSDGGARQALLGALGNAVDQQLNIPAFETSATALDALRNDLASATPAQIPALLASLNLLLCDVRAVLEEANGGGFALLLLPPSRLLPPLGSVQYQVAISNQQNVRRTFALEVGGLPPGVTATLNAPTTTLGPLENFTFTTPVFVTLTHTGGALAPFEFTLTATDVAVPAASRTAFGSATVRDDFISIVEVRPTPGFAEQGTPVSVRARVYNSVNVPRTGFVHANLKSSAGNFAQFIGTVGQIALGSAAEIVDFDFSFTPSASLADGVYSLEVIISSDGGGAPFGGAIAEAPLLLGAPLAGLITADPTHLPAGDRVVQTSLTIDRDAVVNPTAKLVAALQTPGEAKQIAFHEDLAYVCGNTSVAIVDVSDPRSPMLLDTFFDGPSELGADFNSVGCSIVDGHLVVGFDKGGAPPPPTRLAVFDLTDPLQPALVSSTPFNRTIGGGLAFTLGDFGFMTTSQITFNVFSGFIFQQNGDLLAFDLSDVTAPVLAGSLFPAGDPVLGGPNMIFASALLPGEVALLTSTTATGDGFGTGPGDGRILAVDLSAPATPTTVGELLLPEPTLVQGIAVEGDLALVTGDTVGFSTAFSGFVGTLTLSTVDVSNPTSPQTIATAVTSLTDPDGSSAISLGGSLFAVGGARIGSRHVLLLVDATDPMAVRFMPFDVPAAITSLRRVGQQLFATSSAGLTVFDLGSVPGPVLTARVEVPKGTGVELVPGSFNVAPTEILAGLGSDVYVWEQPPVDVITWSQTVAGLAPGEVREVALGGRLEFVLPAFGSGEIELAPAAVVGEQIVGIAPERHSLNLPATATYTVTLRNPDTSDVVYDVDVVALPPEWVQIPAQVMVPAQGSVDVALQVTPDLAARFAESYDFFVNVAAPGISGSAGANLTISNSADLGGNPGASTFALSAVVTPSERTAGRGTPARFTFTITNEGNRDDFAQLFAALPAGWQAIGEPNGTPVEPGAGNAREIEVSITPPFDAPPGPVDIPVNLHSFNAGLQATLVVRVNVAGRGVEVDLGPNPGTPATTFSFFVRNLGTETDTFDVDVGGIFAPIAMLSEEEITLPAGHTHTFQITLGDVGLALPGSPLLVVTATSRTEPAVSRSDTATVVVPAEGGLAAEIDPADRTLPAPGPAPAVLEVANLGNGEDEITAEIVATSGPVAAMLRGLDGQPAASVPGVFLLAHGAAQVPVDLALTTPGTGSVTVRVTSARDPGRTAEATAVVRTEEVQPTPTPSGIPTPTPTPEPSATPTGAPSATPTASPSATPTASPTPAPTPSAVPGDADAFKCYRVRSLQGTPRFRPIDGVSIEDPVESNLVDVLREIHLCNPVAVDSTEPADPDTHLACYTLRKEPGQPATPLATVEIANRFGPQTVRFIEAPGPTTLCVPGEAHLAGTQAGEPHALDRYRCRGVRAVTPRRISPAPVLTLEDEFEQKRMRVRKVSLLCAPASVDESQVLEPETWLACYDMAQVSGQRAFVAPGVIESSNELAEQSLVVRNAQRRLCVPTEVGEVR